MNAGTPQNSVKLASPPGQSWRKAHPEDEALLLALFAESKQAELAPLTCAGMSTEPFMAMQYQARAMDYTMRYPLAENQLLLAGNGEFAGRLLVHRSGSAWRIVDIAVFARFRGQGIATEAIKQLCSEAEGAEAQLELCALRSNPAVRLYTRLGFRYTVSDDPVLLHMRHESRFCSRALPKHEPIQGRAA